MDFFSYNQTAAEFLAYAALDLFPDARLLGGRGTSRYFYYDFEFPFPHDKLTLSLIEERMARLLKSETVKKREMLASNALELFFARKQPAVAERLAGLDGLVTICEIKDFLDPCIFPFALSFPFRPHFKLLEIEDRSYEGANKVRILGALAADKDALKAVLKAPSPTALSHTRAVAEQKLFLPLSEGHWLWLPKGEHVRQLLLAQWKRIITREKFNCISTADGESTLEDLHHACFLKTNIDKLAEIAHLPQPLEGAGCEGLFETQSAFSDRLTLFCNEENFLQSCISSLHFILEMPRILGFEFQLILGLSSAKGTRSKQLIAVLKDALEKSGLEYAVEKIYSVESEAQIEVRLPDALGRLWKGPYISVPTQTDTPVLSCSLFGTMERFIALLLERHAGQLPLWLAPEQVRLIPLTEKAGRYATRVQQSLESAGIRSTMDARPNADLGSRLYQAIAEKVPFAVILGNREVEAEDLVVKALGSHKDERMHSDALIERIKLNEENEL